MGAWKYCSTAEDYPLSIPSPPVYSVHEIVEAAILFDDKEPDCPHCGKKGCYSQDDFVKGLSKLLNKALENSDLSSLF